MNRALVITCSILLLCTACRRTVMVVCKDPQLVLEQQGYDTTEWDTIITRVYNPGFAQPVVADTFIAESVNDVLLVTVYPDDIKDFEIFLPSVGRTYRLHETGLTRRTEEMPAKEEKECYNDISYTLDNGKEVQRFFHHNEPIVKNYLVK